MRVFKEQQRFSQWWLYLIVALTAGGWLLLINKEVKKGVNLRDLALIIFFGLLITLASAGIFLLRLETRIDSSGVTASFAPLPFLTKRFSWKEMRKIFVRQYSPISEYGGWGIRGFCRSKAYNVSGYHGIQIVTREGKKFLIGTKEPRKVEKVLNYYLEKYSYLNN